ncbi:pyridoxal phosphate-dependent aminotransferase [Clostridium acetobutylicum]|uniref:Aminotransferase n=1 Tax=Clostridium acetobutylicum (strain ATCC 824 / DSM 792 / JCM 1419 / IAM 19013 / LMG 5710 / NBRC 13948 / NRRL B-527 / VKM B-1787 / 2291 / W) TaxID=272562 RepID=Q97I35_CLOAB|nr:pyridoxal phosphate-dependent aminotransferase [Clostridium acetobutylicum]AAK79784.1 Aspartate Aminotransferase [Clostridium acetobutylicum ATCC 824]
MNFSKKAGQIAASITLEITAKADEMKANGINVIGFGAGQPDFNTPKNIRDAAIYAIENGYTKYTPVSGIKELKMAICDKFKRDNNLNYSLSNIIVSTGAKQCLSDTFSALLNPGDEVILSAPYWVTYPELIKLNDGISVIINTTEENHFKLSVDDLENAYTSKTKAILINSPSNPTGTVYTETELKAIAEFAKEKDLFIISDEIYEKLIYDGERHVSIASLSQDAFNRTVVINGMSKSYAMTGWRLGYAASGSSEFIKLMSHIQAHTTSNANSITQYASVEALNGRQEELHSMVTEFEKRRTYMSKRVNNITGIHCLLPKGAFYVMMNISNLFGKEINGVKINNSVDFSKELLSENKVAVVPGTGFGNDNYVRLSYATSMDNIVKGLDEIENFIGKLR